MVLRRVSVLALVAAFAVTGVFSQQPSRRIRNLGKPLHELVRPGEGALLVELISDPPLIAGPALGISYLEWLAKLAPAIFVLHVQEGRAALTRRDTWVETVFTATVERVLKRPDTVRLNTRQTVRFTQDGGVVLVRGTRVEGVIDWANPVKVGSRYLSFANVDVDGTLLVGPSGMFEFNPATGVTAVMKLHLDNDIEKFSPEFLLARLESLIEAQKP